MDFPRKRLCFFTGETSIIERTRIKCWYHLKCLNDGFVSYKHRAFRFTRLMDWSVVDYCDVFNQLFGLSFWRHPFTAEHPLLSKWCNATFLQIGFSEEVTNSSWSQKVLMHGFSIFEDEYIPLNLFRTLDMIHSSNCAASYGEACDCGSFLLFKSYSSWRDVTF